LLKIVDLYNSENGNLPVKFLGILLLGNKKPLARGGFTSRGYPDILRMVHECKKYSRNYKKT